MEALEIVHPAVEQHDERNVVFVRLGEPVTELLRVFQAFHGTSSMT